MNFDVPVTSEKFELTSKTSSDLTFNTPTIRNPFKYDAIKKGGSLHILGQKMTGMSFPRLDIRLEFSKKSP